MMRVKTIVRFRDLEADVIREKGGEFTVTQERGDKLLKRGFVEKLTELKKEKNQAAK